jgi:hypothetical protein
MNEKFSPLPATFGSKIQPVFGLLAQFVPPTPPPHPM